MHDEGDFEDGDNITSQGETFEAQIWDLPNIA